MSIKLVAFDLDGTIYTNKVSEKVKLAFKKLIEKNIKILPITGRSLKSTIEILDKAEVPYDKRELAVLTTGALVQNLNTKIVQNCNFLDKSNYLKLQKLENRNIHLTVYTTDTLYYTNLCDELLKDASELKDTLIELKKPEDLTEDICRFNFMGEEKYLTEFENKYRKELEKDFYVMRTIPISLELLSKNSSKANGLKIVMDYYGLNEDEVLAIGDGNNDISMFNLVENSVAMGNASQNVKKHAKYITDTVENDGFYTILLKMGLI